MAKPICFELWDPTEKPQSGHQQQVVHPAEGGERMEEKGEMTGFA